MRVAFSSSFASVDFVLRNISRTGVVVFLAFCELRTTNITGCACVEEVRELNFAKSVVCTSACVCECRAHFGHAAADAGAGLRVARRYVNDTLRSSYAVLHSTALVIFYFCHCVTMRRAAAVNPSRTT